MGESGKGKKPKKGGAYIGIRNFYEFSPELYNGRIFVTHNNVGAGSRTGCCVLQTMPESPASYQWYVPSVGLTGQAQEDGSIATIAEPTGIFITASAGSSTAVDVWVKLSKPYKNDVTGETYKDSGSCAADAAGTSNVCGIHIHSGSGCEDSTAQGGHYFDASVNDPWKTVRMQSFGQFGYQSKIELGLDAASVEGMVFVIHNSTGARVGAESSPRIHNNSFLYNIHFYFDARWNSDT